MLLEALPELVRLVPDVHLLVAGPGDADEVRAAVPPSLRGRVELLGLVSDEDKPRVFASGHVYCAPNTHGESFGIVLVEAMSAGTPVVASDLEAFRRVLEDGAAGVLVPVRDPGALATALAELLGTSAAAARWRRGPGRWSSATTGGRSPPRSWPCTRRRRDRSPAEPVARRRGPRGPGRLLDADLDGTRARTTTPAGSSRRCGAGSRSGRADRPLRERHRRPPDRPS